MWVAAPILPGTNEYEQAEALSKIVGAPDYEVPALAGKLCEKIELSSALLSKGAAAIRAFCGVGIERAKDCVDSPSARRWDLVRGANCYLHRGTNDRGQSGTDTWAIKNILISTADRIASAPAIRQGYGVVNARRAVELAKREKHALKVTGCSPPRVTDGLLVFVYHDDEAKTVHLAGSFNSWGVQETSLSRNEEGLWLVEIDAPARGRYEYKFVVDGQRWIEDPSNGRKVPDNHGGLNSVITIE